MQIHFLSTIGVDYDLDLAPYWIKYYKERNFDSYTVFLHREKGNIPDIVQKMYRDAGFNVRCVNGIYNGGKLCAFCFTNFVNNLDENDFYTIADADEFQTMMNGTPIPYHYLAERYDIVQGLFEERYSDTLEVCNRDPFIQYPHKEPYTGDYMKTWCPPYLEHIQWPLLYRSKIVLARACENVRMYGMHVLNEISCTAKVFTDCKIVHFPWREGAARKIAKKSYYAKVCEYNEVTGELISVKKEIKDFALQPC